jgi:hypothetical protein
MAGDKDQGITGRNSLDAPPTSARREKRLKTERAD